MREASPMTIHPTRARRGVVALVALLASALVAAVTPAPASAVAPPPRRIVTGWGYYSSTSVSALTSLQDNKDLFTEVSPFWYSASWDGSKPGVSPAQYAANKATVLPALKATGIKILPTITDGMAAGRMAAVLTNPTTRTTFVNSIVTTVTANDYAGIDLDFEGFAFADGRSTWAATKPAWTVFIKQLSAALHKEGKLLSVTTPYMTGPSTGYWVYDWAGISSSIDRLRVMTYDYHVAVAGPIGPIAWVDQVAAYAVSVVASGKVQMGVASYGRDWRTGLTYSGLVATCPTVAPVGASLAQQATLLQDIVWAKGSRYTFSAAGAPSYLTTVTAPNFAAPGMHIDIAPVSTWAPVEKERTFATKLTFTGRYSQKVVTTGTAAIATKAVTVASTSGLAVSLVVTGAGIAASTKITAINATTKVVTLSAATTAAVNGTLTFAGLVPASCTVSRTAWYDEADAAVARAALVDKYHLAGIAQWTIGGEDPTQWSKLRAYARTIAPTPSTVVMAATSPTVWGKSSSITVAAKSAGLPVSGAAVTLQSHPAGVTAWTTLATGVTSSTGTAAFHLPCRGRGQLRSSDRVDHGERRRTHRGADHAKCHDRDPGALRRCARATQARATGAEGSASGVGVGPLVDSEGDHSRSLRPHDVHGTPDRAARDDEVPCRGLRHPGHAGQLWLRQRRPQLGRVG